MKPSDKISELIHQSLTWDGHHCIIIVTHLKQNTHHYKPYPHHSVTSSRHPATIRICTQKSSYSRNNKNKHVMLPTLLATVALRSLHFCIQLKYSTSLTIFPSVNN
ncbi:hypothetical protein Celaphus_00016048, partial [Cervus elaphus hippelaphus]